MENINMDLEKLAKEYLESIMNYEFDVYTLIYLENCLNSYFEHNVIDSNFPYSIIKSDCTFLRILILRPRIFKELYKIQNVSCGLLEPKQFFSEFMKKLRLLALEQLKKSEITTYNFAQLFILLSPKDFEEHLKIFYLEYPNSNKKNYAHLSNLVDFLGVYKRHYKKADSMVFIKDFMDALSTASNKIHLKLKYIDTNITANELVGDYLNSVQKNEIDFFDLCHIVDNLYSDLNTNLLSYRADLNVLCWILAESVQYDLCLIMQKPKLFQILLKLYVESGYQKLLSFFTDFYDSFQKEIQSV